MGQGNINVAVPRTRRAQKRSPATGSQVKSLVRGLSILDRLAEAQDGIALTDLAQRVGLPASTTHRLLNTLVAQGFVRQDEPSGRWMIGVECFAVGNAFLYSRDFVSVSRPYMRRLMEQSGETANLSVLDDGQAILLSQVECHEMMRMLARLGSRTPLHASGVGKALLAALPEKEVSNILHRRGLPRMTETTIDTPEKLMQDLQQVRVRGYAVDDEEHAVGLRCVAATIHDEYAEPLASISLSGPRARISRERMAGLGSLVLEATTEITAALGGRLPAWRTPGPDK